MRGSRTTLPEVPGFTGVLQLGEAVDRAAEVPLQPWELVGRAAVGDRRHLRHDPLRQLVEVGARQSDVGDGVKARLFAAVLMGDEAVRIADRHRLG